MAGPPKAVRRARGGKSAPGKGRGGPKKPSGPKSAPRPGAAKPGGSPSSSAKSGAAKSSSAKSASTKSAGEKPSSSTRSAAKPAGSGAKSGGGRPGSASGGDGRGARELRVRVKTAKGRKLSSTLWLDRQLNDPFVQRAQREGFRGRAAFKLEGVDDKHPFLRPGMSVVDLGCAPGGWLQICVDRINALGQRRNKPQGRLLGVDIQEVEPLPGAELMQLDFLEDGADAAVKAALGGPADAVLSDMAAASSGHRATDHLRIMALAEAAAHFAADVLAPGGVFLAKTLQGGSDRDLLTLLKRDWTEVRHIKPPASRKDSAEMFVLATGFRGARAAPEAAPDP